MANSWRSRERTSASINCVQVIKRNQRRRLSCCASWARDSMSGVGTAASTAASLVRLSIGIGDLLRQCRAGKVAFELGLAAQVLDRPLELVVLQLGPGMQ